MNAKQVVEAIFADLNGRAGFGNTIDEVDDDILEEMRNGWRELIEDAIEAEVNLASHNLTP